ncbi:MAG TPA: ATP-binding cassette domain-containing protein [Verrucomicrobiae bacterium]|nr:ATP-binding cassette domain-containing protein [Verrucomicrobiae bacterium]
MNSEAFIELSGVDVVWEGGTTALLRDVNWRIAHGECWAVGGAPASGKTSLLATAASLNRPGAGSQRMFGRDLAEATEEEQVNWRRRIGYVFETGGRLLNHLTIAQNVALPLRYHLDLDDEPLGERVDQLLARAELRTLARAMPSRLSLRQQQRASLARALAVPTEVLFLDNPLSGLGQRDVRWWTDYLHELRREHTTGGAVLTVVATCDDFRAWLELATHFAVIDNEQFRVLGGREQVLASNEPLVRELL